MKAVAHGLTLLIATPAAAQTVAAVSQIDVGSVDTKAIDTNLDGHPVPTDDVPIYIGNTADSADAIVIDSGRNFPPGIAFRRFLGDAAAPQPVSVGTQLGYLDFRGYSGSQFWNAASLDVIVDGSMPFATDGLPPTEMRFAVSDGNTVYSAMELRADGSLQIGANVANQFFGPGALGSPKLYVNAADGHWGEIINGGQGGGTGFALRTHTLGETADDFLIGASSGEGTGSFKFSVRGNGDVHVGGDLLIGDTNVGDELVQLNSQVGQIGDDVDALGTRVSNVETSIAAFTGNFGAAAGPNAIAVGSTSSATSANSTAIGQQTTATGSNAVAIGSFARANGASAVAHGDNSVASGAGAIAFGSVSTATGSASTALGTNSHAVRDDTVAVGGASLAEATGATAVGVRAIALGEASSALGADARATQSGSTAVGAGATTTAANQVTLGGTGTSVRIGDIAASTAAQVGPVSAVTVDSDGTLGRQTVVTSQQFDRAQIGVQSAMAVADQQLAALQGRVDGVEGQVGQLFNLANVDRRETRRGIAAVAALAQPPYPSAEGKTSYASNVAYYRGEMGFSAGIMHRLKGDVGISAGVSYAGGKNTAARLGVAGEF